MSGATAARLQRGVQVGRTRTVELLLDEASYATRELWRSRIVLVFTFVLPLAWLGIVGSIAGAAVDQNSGAPVMQFVTPAAALMGIMFAAYPPVARSLAEARERHLLKRVEGSPLPVWMYLLGRVGGAVLLAFSSVLVMLAVGMLFWDVQIIWRTLPATLVTLVVATASFAALGLAVGALASSSSLAQTFAVASAMAVSFLSGLFTLGSTPPDWMTTLGQLFPSVHVLNQLWDQFSPALGGSGWELGELAAVGIWGILGLAVAAWALRRAGVYQQSNPRRPLPILVVGRSRSIADEPELTAEAELTSRPRMTPATVVAAARPTSLGLISDQTSWSIRSSRRDTGWIAFAVGMPVALYAFMASQYASSGETPFGMPFAFYYACAMAVYGIGITAFVNVPAAVATLRDRLVLKRLRGTPLAPLEYMCGRTSAVLLLALLTVALILAVGLAFFGMTMTVAGLPLAVFVTILGTMTLTVCGYALIGLVPNARAAGVVGLAILLLLAFVSDIFVIGSSVPAWFATVGSLFPLRPFVHALAGSLNPAGVSVDWVDIAALVAWLAVAGLFAIRRWRWEPAPERAR
jgi:ABC-type multidrug transport system permease subunit